jgi:hypothetical protein
MATTGTQIFETAMALMGLLDDTGAADISDNLEHKLKCVPIINLLLQECYLASDSFAVADGGDGIYSRTVPVPIAALANSIPLDDGVCQSVLPYGVAAHLLLSAEDTTGKASFYQQKFEENLVKLRNTVPSAAEEIEDLYGGCSISDGVSWR